DAGAALPGLGHPLEGDGVRLGHVGPLDDDEISVGEVLHGLCGTATTERGSQTGNRGGVSYAGLVLDLDRARGGEELLDQIVLLVVDGRAAEAGDAHRAPEGAALLVLVLPVLPAGLDEAVGDHVHRRVEIEVLPLGRVRAAVAHRGLAEVGVRELLAGRALGAQPAAGDRGLRVPLDLDDLAVLMEDALAAADGAVGADALGHAIGRAGARHRAAGPRGRDSAAASCGIRPAELPEHRPVEEREASHGLMLPTCAHRHGGSAAPTAQPASGPASV